MVEKAADFNENVIQWVTGSLSTSQLIDFCWVGSSNWFLKFEEDGSRKRKSFGSGNWTYGIKLILRKHVFKNLFLLFFF